MLRRTFFKSALSVAATAAVSPAIATEKLLGPLHLPKTDAAAFGLRADVLEDLAQWWADRTDQWFANQLLGVETGEKRNA